MIFFKSIKGKGNEMKKNLTRREILKYGLYGSAASLLLPGAWPAWGSRRQVNTPNVLLISIDTVRKDHCSVYGYNRDTTPNLRKFAEQGARFDLAYSACSSTAPSHASMFTSLYPPAHQVLRNGYKLGNEYNTLAEQLSSLGYQTAACVSSFVLNAKFGLAQGFTFYDDDFKEGTQSITKKYFPGQPDIGDQRAGANTLKAIDWLKNKRNPDAPFYLFLHYFDPHEPYDPPEPFRSQFLSQKNEPNYLEKILAKIQNKPLIDLEKISSLYDGELAFTDQEIGKVFEVLKHLGLEEDTLVVLTSDHGEGLGQHNHIGHSINIYEEAVRVPLLFRWPNHIPTGLELSAPVEGVDIMPTILDLIGVNLEGLSLHGQSMASALRGGSETDKDRPVYLYREYYTGRYRGLYKKTFFKGNQFAIRKGKWKYIEGKEENSKELFDLSSDPQELENIETKFPDKASELSAQLENWVEKYTKKGLNQQNIPKEDLERLKALGYVN
jgi:arylsulfatase A-like enzyme